MSSAKITPGVHCGDIRTVVIENEVIRLTVMPELGGKIFDFVYKPRNHNFLWHHPRLKPCRVQLGASYDDHFCGGWDELFPNDAAGLFQGRELPDHGELWCQPWSYSIEKDSAEEVTLYMRRDGSVTTAVIEKWITLRSGAPVASFSHRITNVGHDCIDFLWKLHPALTITEHHRVQVPARQAEYVGTKWSRLSGADRRFEWPLARSSSGEINDISRMLPADSGKRDFVYLTELSDGWCSLFDSKTGLGFGLAFPREIFRSVWLFMTYGGWRGLNTVVLEPCTTVPKDLDTAYRLGQCRRLEPGQSLECQVAAVAYEGISEVETIRPDGTVVESALPCEPISTIGRGSDLPLGS